MNVSPGPSIPSFPPQELPVGAALHVPARGEGTLLIPTGSVTDTFVAAGAHPDTFVVTHDQCSASHLACTRIDGNGRITGQVGASLPGFGWIEQVAMDTARHLVYALHRDQVTCLDAESGAECGQCEVAPRTHDRETFPAPRLVVDPAGGLMLCDRNHLRRFDPFLQPRSSTDLGFVPTVQGFLADGSLYLEGASPSKETRCVTVLAADGTTRFSTTTAVVDRPVGIAQDGTLHCIETNAKGQRTLVRFSPATGDVERFQASPAATAALPLPDGSVVVLEESPGHLGLALHAPSGEAVHRWTLAAPEGSQRREDDESRIDGFILSADGRHAVVQAGLGFPCSHTIYRVDLAHPQASHGLKAALASLADRVRGSSTVAPLFHAHRDTEPRLLADGRIVVRQVSSISGSESFVVLTSDGTVEKELPRSRHVRQELEQYLGAADVPGGTERPLHPAQPSSWDALPEGLLESSPLGRRSPEGSDHVSLAAPVDPVTRATLAASPGSTFAPLLDLALTSAACSTVTTPGGVSTFQVFPQHIELAGTSSSDGKAFPVAFLDQDDATFTTALPLRLGDEAALVAGASDGTVVLVTDQEMAPLGSHVARYALGAPVEHLALAPDGTVVATGADGAALAIRPPLPRGGTVEAVLPSSPAGTAASITMDASQVRIGGLSIPRRATPEA